jgi:hypothetical protein
MRDSPAVEPVSRKRRVFRGLWCVYTFQPRTAKTCQRDQIVKVMAVFERHIANFVTM